MKGDSHVVPKAEITALLQTQAKEMASMRQQQGNGVSQLLQAFCVAGFMFSNTSTFLKLGSFDLSRESLKSMHDIKVINIIQTLCLASFILLAFVQFFQAQNRDTKVSEPKVKNRELAFPYQMRAQFYFLAGPDELLKVLLDHKNREQWDHGLSKAIIDSATNQIQLTYKSTSNDHLDYNERIHIKYFVDGDRFYIVE